jgi:hypothetical protein
MTLEQPAKATFNRKNVRHGCECCYRTIDVTAVIQGHVRDLILDVNLATLPTKSARTEMWKAHQWNWRNKAQVSYMTTLSGYHWRGGERTTQFYHYVGPSNTNSVNSTNTGYRAFSTLVALQSWTKHTIRRTRSWEWHGRTYNRTRSNVSTK